MAKYPKLPIVRKCEVCTINLYDIGGTVQPQIKPCGIIGKYRKDKKDRKDCPYESAEERAAITYSHDQMKKDIERKPG